MSRVVLILFRYCRSFLAIYLCLIVGRGVSVLLPVAIPGSIIGMLLLFTLLATQILPVEWVRPGCQLIIRYMALLFVPISVGIMNDIDILSAQFAPIVVSCLVSTLIVLVTVGLLADRLQRKEGDDA